MGQRLAIDIGGTFTDLFLWDGSKICTAKLPTTSADQSEAVLQGASELTEHVDAFLHGKVEDEVAVTRELKALEDKIAGVIERAADAYATILLPMRPISKLVWRRRIPASTLLPFRHCTTRPDCTYC